MSTDRRVRTPRAHTVLATPLTDGCACIMGRWTAPTITLTVGTTEAAFVPWVEDFVEGGLELSGNSIILPETGAYTVAVRAYVVLNNLVPGTTRIPVDAFEFNSNLEIFDDVVYIDQDRTFAFLKGFDIARLDAGDDLLFRVRLSVIGTQPGDSVQIEPRLTIMKICGCDQGPV